MIEEEGDAWLIPLLQLLSTSIRVKLSPLHHPQPKTTQISVLTTSPASGLSTMGCMTTAISLPPAATSAIQILYSPPQTNRTFSILYPNDPQLRFQLLSLFLSLSPLPFYRPTPNCNGPTSFFDWPTSVLYSPYLWRPTSEMVLMGDALHELIPWPIQRIWYSNPSTLSPKESSPKESSPPSASCSMANNTKSNDQRKRLLLDCDGSGEIVAEGRICSTNPEDKVHFVPLGPDASKVWVQVLKIESAKVCRPNLEVHFVGDALGTTVAWPNDRLRFM